VLVVLLSVADLHPPLLRRRRFLPSRIAVHVITPSHKRTFIRIRLRLRLRLRIPVRIRVNDR